MPLRPPALLLFGAQALTHLHHLLDAVAPEEGCALLLGQRLPAAAAAAADDAAETWRLQRIWPCRNIWEPASERRRRFAIDPREQLRAIHWGRSQGLEVLGAVHSHPCSPPLPSATDQALAVWPMLMLIRGVRAAPPGIQAAPEQGQELRCWWLEADSPPLQLPWRMED